MKSKLTFIRLMALILIFELGSMASPALARTQDNGRDPVAAAGEQCDFVRSAKKGAIAKNQI